MTTAAISSNHFRVPLAEQIRDFLDKVKKSKIFAIKDLCNKSLFKGEDLKKNKLKQRKVWREKETWDEIGKEMEKKVLTHLVPISSNHPLSGTDLLVFKNEYVGTLPLNGIRHSEFVEVTQLLIDIFYEKTRFKFDLKLSEKSLNMVIRDFAILMTRKTSRELIKRLAKGSNDIFIIEGEEFIARHFSKDGKLVKQELSVCSNWFLPSQIGRAAQLNRMLYKIPIPSYLSFAHECIHIEHFQEELLYSKKISDIAAGEYTHEEERRTISGSKDNFVIWNKEPKNWQNEAAQRPWPGYKRVNEWTIRSEFGLPVREDHYAGGDLSPGDFSKEDYMSMWQECQTIDAKIDLEKIKRFIEKV
ncbi:MAG: hypothetical protein L0207_01465 [Chlamydiae bacterium]|nr:hypothetical protein [Chlamydiota bacterium]